MLNNNIFSKISVLKKNHTHIKNIYEKSLTLTEKILFSHMKNITNEKIPKRDDSYIKLYPDRIVMQDATAQMATLQFINSGFSKVGVPTSIHCDHLIKAENDYTEDLSKAEKDNKEVYDFLESASLKYGMDFWKPGSGIIHQVVLENYAYPSCLIVGTDSHTPNAGGIGSIAIGVGGTDAVDVMIGEPFILKCPKIIGVKLCGTLNNWSAPKDIILNLMDTLTVKGGTGSVVEFFGEGTSCLTTTGKATITNMGAEHGATTSIFPADVHTIEYLKNTNRENISETILKNMDLFTSDKEVVESPDKFYDRVIEINLNKIKPSIAGPHSPDIINTTCTIRDYLYKKKFPIEISAALIGSCTNSSYEDMKKVLYLGEFAMKNNLKCKVPMYISPGSVSIANLLHKNINILNFVNAKILSNSCGPCIGQWNRKNQKNEMNSIITSYNRNFPGRNDGNRETLAFIASPEMVFAMSLSGRLDFDPIKDSIKNENNKKIKFPVKLPNIEITKKDFYISKNKNSIDIQKQPDIRIDKNSDRLELLRKFPGFFKDKFKDMFVLLKAKGKCTTDHISPAGPWLKYRGHLTNISQNTYMGVFNDYTQKIGLGIDLIDDKKQKSFYNISMNYKIHKKYWIVIGDENFGEGSSREHAAMQPRSLGCLVIIAKSFARIHENNLKKHGILALTFCNKNDYDKISQYDNISILDISSFSVNQNINVLLKNENNILTTILCTHTYSYEQIRWFKSGSALNYIASK
jgi:aconitate hydratase